MANKFRPGIPDNFSLNVAPVQDLGDYLDEPQPVPRPQRQATPVAAPRPEEPKAPVAKSPAPSVPTPPAQMRPAANAVDIALPPTEIRRNATVTQSTPVPLEVTAQERVPRPKGPRREISMTPEGMRMLDELLDLIRSGSGQRDTTANELIHALVLLAFEAKDQLDPYSIPKRGRWGSPTARAYPLELKNAVLKAVRQKTGDGA